MFTRIRLDPLGRQVLHHDCISVIVSRFTFFTKNLVICCNQVTNFFRTSHGFAIASSAWGPCHFGPFKDLTISVSKEMSMNIVLTQILTSLGCGLYKTLHEKNWRENLRVLEFHHPPNFPEFLQPLRDLRIQRIAPFYRGFLFLVLGFYWLGCHQAPISHQP